MLYEMHITVDPETNLDNWIDFNQERGNKPLHIMLMDGDHPSQVMNALTFSGTDEEMRKWGAEELTQVAIAGFQAIRVKVEVPLDHSLPYAGLVKYYESHVKMLLPESQLPMLIAVTEALHVHASFNDLKMFDTGFMKAYLTRRFYGEDMFEAAEDLNRSYTEVLEMLPSVRMEKEAVIIDTNPGLDSGWAAQDD